MPGAEGMSPNTGALTCPAGLPQCSLSLAEEINTSILLVGEHSIITYFHRFDQLCVLRPLSPPPAATLEASLRETDRHQTKGVSIGV